MSAPAAPSGNRYDIAVLGGGPGGYVAALRAGQMGRRVLLVERGRVGGTCLNSGCIPSKALIHAAHLRHSFSRAGEFGLRVGECTVDFGAVLARNRSVVDRLAGGIERLCAARSVEVVRGEGRLAGKNALAVSAVGGERRIEADFIILATGSTAVGIPGFPFDGTRVVSPNDAVWLDRVPGEFVVIGAGASGVELGTAYRMLGARVTLVEMMDTILPGTDRDLVRVVARSLDRLGIEVLTGAKATGLGTDGVRVDAGGEERTIPADTVMVSVGRRPNTAGIGLDGAGIELDAKGFVRTGPDCRTNVPTIFAIGDCAGPPMLAHKASREGIVAVEAASGVAGAHRPRAVPSVIFSIPEAASAGLTEQEAAAAGHSTATGRFPMSALGRALTVGEADGLVKVVAEAKSGKVLGVHMACSGASDLIGEAALAVETGATLDDLAGTVHPHPTFTEALAEAAEACRKRAIHLL